MRVRRLALPIVVALGAAGAAVPTFAAGPAPASGSFTAYDYGWAANGNTNATRLTVAPGATVTFSYPVGINQHNADFGSGPKPSSCMQTAGVSSGSVPPLPHRPTVPGWSGTCTFSSPGVYQFHCDLHTFMTGTVVVQGPPGSPLAGRPAIRSPQRGSAVRGAVRLSRAAGGGRLEIDLRTSARSLHRRGNAPVRIGRLIKQNVSPGTVRFAVPLSAAARRAEQSAGRLVVTVELIVTPPGRPAASATRRLTLLS